MTNFVLQAKNLCKTYTGLDVPVLNGIDLSLAKGEQVAIDGTTVTYESLCPKCYLKARGSFS